MSPFFASSVISTLPILEPTYRVSRPFKINISERQKFIDKIGTRDIWAPLFYDSQISKSINADINAEIVSFSKCDKPSECSKLGYFDFSVKALNDSVISPIDDSIIPDLERESPVSISIRDPWVNSTGSHQVLPNAARDLPYSPPQSRSGSIDEDFLYMENHNFSSDDLGAKNVWFLPSQSSDHDIYQVQGRFQSRILRNGTTSLNESLYTNTSYIDFNLSNKKDDKNNCHNSYYTVDKSNSFGAVNDTRRRLMSSNLTHYGDTSTSMMFYSSEDLPCIKSDGNKPNAANFRSTRPNQSVNDSSHSKSITNPFIGNCKSKILIHFKNNSPNHFEFQDVVGHIAEFSVDQYGSRFIQYQVEVANNDQREQIFHEIEPYLLYLMTDVFGNYVLQKFLKFGNNTQRYRIAYSMKGYVADLSIHIYGCRVVQKVIGIIQRSQQISLIKELNDNILQCLKDQNGNHVIQRVIERIPLYEISFLFEKVRGQVITLATHSYGCRVLQKLLEKSNFENKQGYHQKQIGNNCGKDIHFNLSKSKPYYQEDLLKEVLMEAKMLIKNQYGNYLIQHILEKGTREEKQYIIDIIMGSLLYYSKHKFASNVVEKCIHNCTTQQRKYLIAEIVKPFNRDKMMPIKGGPYYSSSLSVMIRDQYANYVIQRLLKVCKRVDRKDYILLSSMIKPELYNLSHANNGKNIISIEKLIF